MTSRMFACGAAVVIATALRAGPADDAMAAAMKLTAAVNYSWTTHIDRGGRSAEIHGQTGGGAYSLLTFTGFAGPSSPGGTGTNAVFLGSDKYVIETASGWTTPPTTTTASSASDNTDSSASKNARGGGTRGGSGGGGMRGRGGAGSRSGGAGGGGGTRGRSGNDSPDTSASVNPRLPTAINLPHEELSLIALNSSDLHLENDVLSGKLTQTGADLLLAPPGAKQRAPKGAAGTFQLWIQNGAVTKYELKLSADGGFAETVTVDLSKIDNTQFTVPSAAKTKLGY